VGSADCQSAIQQVDNLRYQAEKIWARKEIALLESLSWER
jgi:hypothetical protein